jgi:hypothetical protein
VHAETESAEALSPETSEVESVLDEAFMCCPDREVLLR